eukprot:3914446-Pyramimonas_sp.AAC.1
MAEHVAIALCGQVANRPAVIGADCMSAIKVTQRNIAHQLAASSKFAGIRLFAQSLEGQQWLQEVRHVKAHRTQAVIDALPDGEREFAVGNSVVDHHAKKALLQHIGADPEFLSSVHLALERANNFVEIAAA